LIKTKKLKQLIFILYLLLNTIIGLAQPKLNIDSLQKLLSSAKEDTTRILLLAQISSDFTFYNPDSAFELVKQTLRLAQKINYSKGQIYCHATLGKLWWSVGDYSAALRFLLPLEKNAENTTDSWLRINILGFIVASYRDQGDYQEALKYGVKFARLENTFDQCKLCRHCYTAIASIYIEMRHFDSSLFYLNRAFGYSPIFGDDGWMYLVAARTYTELGNYDSAFYFYRQSIPVLTREENEKDLAGAYNNIASLFAKMKQSNSAFLYTRKALSIASAKHYFREFMIANLILSNVYESLNTDSAFAHYKLAMAAKDSLYSQEKQRQISNYKFNAELQQQETISEREQLQSKIKIYALLAALFVLLLIAFILYSNNKQKQKAKTKIEKAYAELKSTQAQLIQQEKMASLGELTAGIAHEIQNPLNFVNNFSDVNKELLTELNEEIEKGNYGDAKAIVQDVINNEEKINHHGKRADAIVKGMLQHSRVSTGKKEPTDINA
jgi:signal transduction histidine kinase